MTAVIELADALFNASSIIKSSIILLLHGGEVGCTTYISIPLTLSCMSTHVSPSLKLLTSALPRGMPRAAHISRARETFELPLNILIFSSNLKYSLTLPKNFQTLRFLEDAETFTEKGFGTSFWHPGKAWVEVPAKKVSAYPLPLAYLWPTSAHLCPNIPTSGPPPHIWPTSGWGGRIRTSVCGDQNPVPFRLATPQKTKKRINIISKSKPPGNEYIQRRPDFGF